MLSVVNALWQLYLPWQLLYQLVSVTKLKVSTMTELHAISQSKRVKPLSSKVSFTFCRMSLLILHDIVKPLESGETPCQTSDQQSAMLQAD